MGDELFEVAKEARRSLKDWASPAVLLMLFSVLGFMLNNQWNARAKYNEDMATIKTSLTFMQASLVDIYTKTDAQKDQALLAEQIKNLDSRVTKLENEQPYKGR